MGLAALASAPALPLKAAPPSAVALKYFSNAKLVVRAHNKCSIDMLSRLFRIDRNVAAEVQSLLAQRGVITAANLDGVSMAVNPMNTHCIPREAMKATNFQSTANTTLSRLKNQFQRTIDQIATDTSESDDTDETLPETSETDSVAQTSS